MMRAPSDACAMAASIAQDSASRNSLRACKTCTDLMHGCVILRGLLRLMVHGFHRRASRSRDTAEAGPASLRKGVPPFTRAHVAHGARRRTNPRRERGLPLLFRVH